MGRWSIGFGIDTHVALISAKVILSCSMSFLLLEIFLFASGYNWTLINVLITLKQDYAWVKQGMIFPFNAYLER